MSVQKIGVLTFHRCINYGSYWQARALVEGLRARGHDAVLLDHQSKRINRAEWKCAFRPVLPTPVPREDYVAYRQKMHAFFCAFEKLPLSPPFELDNPAAMEEYDTVVVGSDEVWNLWHPWYRGCSLFFGEGVRTRRLISYAASFGNFETWGWLDPQWAEPLRKFESISVRDQNSRGVIERTLGFEPEVVLDPCLQFPIRPEGNWRGPEQPFVAVYGHNFSPWFAETVRNWATARGYLLVSIGYRNDWADEQWLTAGPHDFAHAIAQASAVATNFFHGCIFALRNARPLVCEITPYRFHKVRDLMTTVGGENHLVSEDTPAEVYDALLRTPVEPHILNTIKHLQSTSAAYLDRALA
jgi:hypothetical protein